MSRVGRLLGALALAVTSLVMHGATGTPAYACSCARDGIPQFVEGAEAVFTGSVTDRAQSGGDLGPVVYTVAVDQVYKGEVGPEVALSTAPHSAACGLPGLPEGEPLLFFGSGHSDVGRGAGGGNTDFAINLCNGTGATSDRELAEVEAAAGAPHEPEGRSSLDDAPDPAAGDASGTEGSGGSGSDDGVSAWLVGGLGVGALVLAVLVGVLLRRPRTAPDVASG